MSMFRIRGLLPVLLVLLLAACQAAAPATTVPTVTLPPAATASVAPVATATPQPTATPLPPSPTPGPLVVRRYSYEVVNTYPHDPDAFTQGLIFQDGIFYEGTGLRGQSSLRKVDPQTGQVLQMIRLADQYFGEGITIFGDKLYQLTWQSNIGFVYDKDSFERLAEFKYPTEGWGLTHDGSRLIMSDGTSNLYFLDPETLTEIGRVSVRDGNSPVSRLNELEYIEGEVWANVWQTDNIVRIDPDSGQVLAWVNLSNLLDRSQLTQRVDVLNGIAYDAAGDRLFVTGKWWPHLFEITLVPLE